MITMITIIIALNAYFAVKLYKEYSKPDWDLQDNLFLAFITGFLSAITTSVIIALILFYLP